MDEYYTYMNKETTMTDFIFGLYQLDSLESFVHDVDFVNIPDKSNSDSKY